VLALRILPRLGHLRLSAVTRAAVQDFADELTAQGLSASTAQNTLDPLRVIFRRAIRRDVVAVDPTEHLELRRPKGRRERIATPAEAVALLAPLPDFERVLYATATYTSMRRRELRAHGTYPVHAAELTQAARRGEHHREAPREFAGAAAASRSF
jgi:site-specific recombinase XerD